MDSRSIVAIKFDALQRYMMLRTLSGWLPLFVVTEYPKSGGTWVSQMLSAYLQLPFPRNRRPPLASCIMHGHIPPLKGMRNVLCIHRDGRDIAVSLYYHSLFQNEKNSQHLVDRVRKDLNFSDPEDIEFNLPRFLEYVYLRDSSSRSPFRFSWPRFVEAWNREDAICLKYEELICDGAECLGAVLEQLLGVEVDSLRVEKVVEKYSFANQARRAPGVEINSSFLRKGVPGDWKTKFSNQAAMIFEEIAGSTLVELGYEADSSWVERCGRE